ASGFSFWVQPWRWIERRYAVDEFYFPLALVDQRVVVAAEQDGVVDGGVAAVGSVVDVVGIAVPGWSGAAREGTASVSRDEDSADSGWEGAGFAADPDLAQDR
ncbi:hypothetical protein, partial [Lentzea sp. NPDC051838]|uniref:hypothetical protein n=1 Tax=Lentzea sp. NPDC051838 TaxID=3154849 RepID=UPI003416F080